MKKVILNSKKAVKPRLKTVGAKLTFSLKGTIAGIQRSIGRCENGDILFVDMVHAQGPTMCARIPLDAVKDRKELKAGARVTLVVMVQ